VPGSVGILVPPPGYLQGVRALADEFGLLLILDEVMAGFGRCGSWLALERFDVVPDLITFAKGVNSGYVPAGGVIISSRISDFFETRFFPGGLTYSGHPLAMAAIVATLDAMQEEGVVDNARQVGEEVLGPGLRALAERHEVIGDVRGIGLFWALELVNDRQRRTPLAPAQMARIRAGLLERGLLPFLVENRIHVLPPCIVSAAEVAQALAIYDEVLGSL
jgi:taurine--2-oxoglutarate transaminase